MENKKIVFMFGDQHVAEDGKKFFQKEFSLSIILFHRIFGIN
jgi:hypothetical protein